MNIPLPKRVAILYTDARREYFPTEQAYISEAEVEQRAKLIATYFAKMNIDTILFPGDANLSDNLKKYKPDFVLNLVDSVYGKDYLSASVPGTLEILNIPYTGCGIMGQAINANKFLTKNLMEQWGLTIPKYQLIKSIDDEVDDNLDYPIITKLNETHCSIEIDDSAVCEDEKSLKKRVDFLITTYKQPVILEEFIAGREITVIVTEGVHTKVYAAEKIFNPKFVGKYQIVSFNANWQEDVEESISYQKYELPPRVKEQIKTAFEIIRMEDYGKFDIRLDLSGRHYIIDANTNPSLGPKNNSAIGTVLDLYGISFPDILERIILNTHLDTQKSQNSYDQNQKPKS